MAVALEFANVILRGTSIEGRFDGGLAGFKDAFGSFKIIHDESVVVVTFMSTHDAGLFTESLAKSGFREEEDFVVLEPDEDPDVPWLTVGKHEGVRACWLSGGGPGDLVRSIDYEMFFLGGVDAFRRFFRRSREAGFHAEGSSRVPGMVLSGKRILLALRDDRVTVEYFRAETGTSVVLALYNERTGSTSKAVTSLVEILGIVCAED